MRAANFGHWLTRADAVATVALSIAAIAMAIRDDPRDKILRWETISLVAFAMAAAVFLLTKNLLLASAVWACAVLCTTFTAILALRVWYGRRRDGFG